jgi:hypothetical protein
MDSNSMMMLWNLMLTVVVGIIGYILKDKFDELQRLSILLNRTREEIARDNVTQAELDRIVTHLDLRFSKLSAAIDDADISIVSNDTQVRISKRITPNPGISYSERWSFENELYNENIRYVLPAGHEAIVESTPFVYDGYTAYIQDNGIGTLYVYALINNITTVLNNNVGTVDYNTGLISINNLIVDSYTTDAIKIYARTENADIDTLTNKILLINPEDINVTMTGIRI